MPAYNAGITLKETFDSIPKEYVDDIILIDDFSSDNTVEIAHSLNINTCCHAQNMGYGANQKTCYKEALKLGADIVIMLHPDNQYDPKEVPAIATMLAYSDYDCIIASRFLNNGAKHSKMPRYKYFANRFLTKFENIITGENLSEYHSGYRAFKKEVLESMPFDKMSDNFIFDNEMLSLIIYKKFKIAEISVPTKYFKEASSISFLNSLKYGFGVIRVCIAHFLAKINIKTKLYS